MFRFKRQIKNNLSEDQMIRYLENRISAQERNEMEEILSRCAPCRDELEQLRNWLPYRSTLQQQIPAHQPSVEFAARLMQSVRQEMAAAPIQSRPVKTWFPGPAQRRQLGLVAASLVVLAGLWTVYSLVSQTGKSSANLQEKAESVLMDTAANTADSEFANPEISAAGEMSVQDTSEVPAEPEARLFAQPVMTWSVVTKDTVLPASRQSAPEVFVQAVDILIEMRAAIWVDPNRLIVAWPSASVDQSIEPLTRAVSDLTPPATLKVVETAEVETVLTVWLAHESIPAWQALKQPDCQYLILEFGGN